MDAIAKREIAVSRSDRSWRAADPGAGPLPEPKVLRFAFQGELKTVDPYQINESFSLSVNGAVYEGLVRRGPDMKLEPPSPRTGKSSIPCIGVFICARA